MPRRARFHDALPLRFCFILPLILPYFRDAATVCCRHAICRMMFISLAAAARASAHAYELLRHAFAIDI